jgi:transposase InsO family protein
VCRLHPRKVEEGEFRKSWQSTQAGVGGPGTHGFVGSLPSGISWRLAYYVTCINDSSRKIWVYFLKLKFDVFEVFKKWKVMVKTKTSLKLKYLRSHNGGEYEDRGFKLFYAVNGIRMEKTILGTPQQNGMAESINRTLNEHARSMRLHAGLPKTFWTNAVSIVAYLINRGPLVPLDHRLPR